MKLSLTQQLITVTYNIIAYCIYGSITCFTILVVGKVLHINGRHFVLEAFDSNDFGDFINNGLLAGYYLVNIGYVFQTISQWTTINSGIELIELISLKTGNILLLLAILHYCNIIAIKIYARFNSRKTQSINGN